jgi:Adenylate and Guanylate cyclase catalytic domain
MNDRVNKTSICSIVFLDIINYSKKSDSEQIEVKTQFNALINNALKDIAQNDRIILDTGYGAAIACNGSPEDALFISLTIRDEILKSNILTPTPLYVRIGINLGPVRVVNDINGQPNIIGDGINMAQHIMSFAKPNQIVTSRSYYEMTSRLTQEVSQIFEYVGVKHDKHSHEHEIYSVRSLKNQTYSDDTLEVATEVTATPPDTVRLNQNWKYALLALPAIIAFGLIIQKASQPASPTLIIPNESKLAIPASEALLPNETIEKTSPLTADAPLLTLEKAINQLPEKSADTALRLPQVKLEQKSSDEVIAANLKKTKKEALPELPPEYVLPPHKPLPTSASAEAKPVKVTEQKLENSHDQSSEKVNEKPPEKSTWQSLTDSVKNGGNKQCTQAEIAMNQCR